MQFCHIVVLNMVCQCHTKSWNVFFHNPFDCSLLEIRYCVLSIYLVRKGLPLITRGGRINTKLPHVINGRPLYDQ